MASNEKQSKGNKGALMGRAERLAVEEMSRTVVKSRDAWITVAIFLLMLGVICVMDMRLVWSNMKYASTGKEQATEVTKKKFPEPIDKLFAWNQRVKAQVKDLEERVSEESPFSKMWQPWVQATLAKVGEGGGEVMVGEAGWLYYRPSFRFLVSEGKGMGDKGVDASVEAVLAFSADLKKRGIELVVVPAWPKLSIHPEFFGAGMNDGGEVIQPRFYGEWSQRLQAGGVMVFDSSTALLKVKGTESKGSYLKTDSHWNPQGMKEVAVQLGTFLLDKKLVEKGTERAAMESLAIRNSGDLLRMLRLPEAMNIERMEDATVSVVRREDGARWLPKADSEILFLGDSFSNIFSLEGMGWGQDAGLTEHLGAELGQALDVILRNGDGAYATRSMLARELQMGKDRLAGKKVVVWEFAASQITEGKWPILSCDFKQAEETVGDADYIELEGETLQEIRGKVVKIGSVPNPANTVYKDFLTYVEMNELQGEGLESGSRGVAYGLVMREKQLTDMAKIKPGQTIVARLRSWSSAEGDYGRYQRSEPEGDLLFEPINWMDSFTISE